MVNEKFLRSDSVRYDEASRSITHRDKTPP